MTKRLRSPFASLWQVVSYVIRLNVLIFLFSKLKILLQNSGIPQTLPKMQHNKKKRLYFLKLF